MKKMKHLIDHRSYFFAVTISVTAVFLQLVLRNLTTQFSFVFLYPAIVISSFLLGLKTALVTLVLNSLAYLYFFTSLNHTGNVTFSEMLPFIVYFLNGLAIIYLIGQTIGSQKNLHKIVTFSPLPIVVCNRNGIVKMWNPAAENLFGYKHEEIIGEEYPLIPEKEKILFRERLLNIGLGNKILNIETTRRKKDGTNIDVIGSASSLPGSQDVVILFTDLTEVRKSEMLRQKSEKQLQDMIDNSPYIITIKDKAGKYLRVNKRFMSLFNDPHVLVVGKTDFEIFPESKALEYTSNDMVAWRTKRPITVEEHAFFEGEVRTYMSTKFPLIGENENIYAIAGIYVDITKMKNLENELRTAVEVRDRFLNIASHELKTPLTSMKLQLQVYKRQLQKGNKELLEPSRLFKLITDSLRQTSTLEKLVNEMLDISRINIGKLHYEFQDTDLCKIVMDVVDSLRQGVENSGGTIILDSCEHLHGMWDRQRVEQVLVNIITNAAKYGKGKPIHIQTYQDGDFGKIAITDEGIGIAPEDKERIFEQFERAVNDNEVSGFGLGLYISRQIVEAHHGNITVESAKGKGSTFIVALPIFQQFTEERNFTQ